MNNRIFMAAPISGFLIEAEYQEYRKKVLKLISYLRDNGYEVYSELERVSGSEDYDSPGESVAADFRSIRENDYFLLLHPARMQTSSLIEFGYACAYDKKIVAVGKRGDFPYFILGYAAYSNKTKIVEADKLTEDVFPAIKDALGSI